MNLEELIRLLNSIDIDSIKSFNIKYENNDCEINYLSLNEKEK